jgi:hypothetical protein
VDMGRVSIGPIKHFDQMFYAAPSGRNLGLGAPCRRSSPVSAVSSRSRSGNEGSGVGPRPAISVVGASLVVVSVRQPP